MKIKAFHASINDFEKFKLPYELGNTYVRCKMSYLGIFFYDGYETALQFCKEHWWLNDSPYKENSIVYEVELNIDPECIKYTYPFELIYIDDQNSYHKLHTMYRLNGYELIIIRPKTEFEEYLVGDVTPEFCEYSVRQLVVLDETKIQIKQKHAIN